MSGTRFQPHFSRQRSWRDSRDRVPGRAFSPPALPITGYAGIHYDTQQLSPISAGRAAEGIKADLIFEGLESITDGRDRYIAFQLYVPIAIRVYNPVVQRHQQGKVTCNCKDYQSTQSASAHLYWLFTRLNAVLREDRQGSQAQSSGQNSTPVEILSGLSALYPLIEQRRDSLSRDLDDELEFRSDESASEDTRYSSNTMCNESTRAYEDGPFTAHLPRLGRNNAA